MKSLFFKPFTQSYHRRILFTDFSSQPLLSSYTLNISDDDFYKKAIAEDNVENAIVKEQQLETRFDASSCKVFHIVNTVYEDSEGYRFATSHIY